MDKILLSGMAFYAYHGVSLEERRLGHHFEVDAEIHADLKSAGRSDDIKDTIDYREVYRQVDEVIRNNSFQLLEALAEALAARVLSNQLVEIVVIRVKKVHPPIAGQINSTAVEIRRGRNR